jgi:hypothetical protein
LIYQCLAKKTRESPKQSGSKEDVSKLADLNN